jgi:hypothetical protein
VIRAAPLLGDFRDAKVGGCGGKGIISSRQRGRVRMGGENEIKYLPGLPAQSRQVRGTRPPMQLWSDMLAAILQ